LKLQIVIDGTSYEVEVEQDGADDSPQSLPPPASSMIQSSVVPTVAKPLSRTEAKGNVEESKVCRSPIAGIVIRVQAQIGEELQANDLIVVLEAMKMETRITAPIAGTIKSIKVKPGDAVKLNQILADFE
jgi:methylmalonyl-CoA carboxyltransferase 1.3S subunit